MRIRSQLALTIFVTGFLGVAALVTNRYFDAREIFNARADERAHGLMESVEAIALPHLRSGDVRSITQEIGVLAELPRVAYIRIYDQNGAIILQSGSKTAAGPGASLATAEKAPLIELHKATIEPVSKKLLGGVKVAISVESLREDFRNLVWKGIEIGALFLLALAAAAWYIGYLLGRRIEGRPWLSSK